MKQDGLDGLKKHLTSNALKNVESMESIANTPGVSMLTNAIMGGNTISVFLDNLSECDWTINDIMKGSETSKAIIGFDYQDMMTGTIEMTLIREEKIWKIDGLGMPKFDKINIPQADSDKSEE
ncbi:MAG: hypothetical protein IKF07_08110 [Eubacterium sp.]|nr:hypothetical protein [Eubacterium sp.]